MPRSARIAPGGLVYHVLNRASGRFKIFRTDTDFLAFEKTLAEAVQREPGVRLLGWCVMGTHWHLVLWPRRDGQLQRFMHWLTLAHAARWRTSHGTVGIGPLYQGRYKSFAVQSDAHYLTVLRYVERNALRAKLVRRAEAWRWGSLYARRHEDAPLRALLAEGPVGLQRDWVDRVNQPQTAAEEESLRTSIHRSRPFGMPVWQATTAKRLGLQSCFRSPGRPRKTLKRQRGD